MATQDYAPLDAPARTSRTYQRRLGLTEDQHRAIELLAAGNNDTRTAQRLNLNRVTVTRWRLYDPTFRIALDRRRTAVWGTAPDATRSLLPKAIAILQQQIGRSPIRGRLALDVLRQAGIFGRGSHYALAPDACRPTTVEAIVDAEIHRRRAAQVEAAAHAQDPVYAPITAAERNAVTAELIALSAQDPAAGNEAGSEDGETHGRENQLTPVAALAVSPAAPFTRAALAGRPHLRLVS